MKINSLVKVAILSIIITIGIPIIASILGIYRLSNGFPLEFTSFNFLGSETNFWNLTIDFLFWIIIAWAILKFLSIISKNK
jgi:hypothetical protein